MGKKKTLSDSYFEFYMGQETFKKETNFAKSILCCVSCHLLRKVDCKPTDLYSMELCQKLWSSWWAPWEQRIAGAQTRSSVILLHADAPQGGCSTQVGPAVSSVLPMQNSWITKESSVGFPRINFIFNEMGTPSVGLFLFWSIPELSNTVQMLFEIFL